MFSYRKYTEALVVVCLQLTVTQAWFVVAGHCDRETTTFKLVTFSHVTETKKNSETVFIFSEST